MRTRAIILWIAALATIDQAVKIAINSFFLNAKFEIIPSLLEFKPFFNDKHTYVNSLLYHHYDVNLGLLANVAFMLLVTFIVLALYSYYRNALQGNKKFLDTAIVFFVAGIIGALSGNLIWRKGVLDYIYLKPLFIFDLKDLYVNCSVILFLIGVFKSGMLTKSIRIKDVASYTKQTFKRTFFQSKK